VDWGELVSPGPDQAEDFESVLFENADPEEGMGE